VLNSSCHTYFVCTNFHVTSTSTTISILIPLVCLYTNPSSSKRMQVEKDGEYGCSRDAMLMPTQRNITMRRRYAMPRQNAMMKTQVNQTAAQPRFLLAETDCAVS
jgi:hypothetical protein